MGPTGGVPAELAACALSSVGIVAASVGLILFNCANKSDKKSTPQPKSATVSQKQQEQQPQQQQAQPQPQLQQPQSSSSQESGGSSADNPAATANAKKPKVASTKQTSAESVNVKKSRKTTVTARDEDDGEYVENSPNSLSLKVVQVDGRDVLMKDGAPVRVLDAKPK